MNINTDSTFKEIADLRKADRCGEALSLLHRLETQTGTTAEIEYQRAWTFDRLSQESEAVVHYENALRLGLQLESDHLGCFIGLGSSYRCLKKLTKSHQVFENAISQFPRSAALRAFHALTLIDLNRHQEAIVQLCAGLSMESYDELTEYQNALKVYMREILDRFALQSQK